MNTHLKNAIAYSAVKLGLRIQCTAESVDRQLFADVVSKYRSIYGYIPIEWTEYMEVYVKETSAAARYIMALVEEDYCPEELALMALPELRDLYHSVCIETTRTVVTATASGGTSVKRVA